MVVFQLRIYSFYILFILPEQLSESLKALSDSLGQFPHSFRLTARDSSANPLTLKQYVSLKIVSTLAIRVGHCVDLVDDLNQLLSVLVIVCAFDHDFAFGSFSYLGRSDFLLDIDSFLDESSCVLLNQHQLNDIQLLILDPILVKLLQYGPYLIHQFYYGLI